MLDFGCATGIKTLDLAAHVCEIQGIDISPKMLAAAKQNAAERKVQNVDFVQATIFDQHFEEETWDAILRAGFTIAETETIPFNPADGEQYVVGRFIAAQKERGSSGEIILQRNSSRLTQALQI